MPVLWGGTDDYEYSFESEKRQNDEVDFKNGELHHQTTNNNSMGHENLNLSNRKVSNYFTRNNRASLCELEKEFMIINQISASLGDSTG